MLTVFMSMEQGKQVVSVEELGNLHHSHSNHHTHLIGFHMVRMAKDKELLLI
jgi:hypothetical protein